MNVLIASCTDTGIRKAINEDSLCIRVARSEQGLVVLAVICDGMGGLASGEVASASVIQSFLNWFETELPHELPQPDFQRIAARWNGIIQDQNQRIAAYGNQRGIELGTTLTAFLFVEQSEALIAHVGDCRLYCFTDRAELLTEDQTVVTREIKNGKITPEQAEQDPRRNVLLQCIGDSPVVEPVMMRRQVLPGEVYLLCSDGFRHRVSDAEMMQAFSPAVLTDEETMQRQAKAMVDLNMSRQEGDNITIALLKIVA